MNFQTTALALAVAPAAFAQDFPKSLYFPDHDPVPTRYGPYCQQSELAPDGHNGTDSNMAATTLVIGDSYAEFSSSWGGYQNKTGHWVANATESQSYFTTYCGGGVDNDNGLEKICNMGISGTTSESMDYTNARDNQWSWAYTNSTTQESLVTKAFDAAPQAKRVIYYISGNDYMYGLCRDSMGDIENLIEASLHSIVDQAWKKNQLSPVDVTMISYANPEASFADSQKPITVKMPANYTPPAEDDADQDFSSINVVQVPFLSNLAAGQFCDNSDSECNQWQAGRVVSKIGGKAISEFGDHFGVQEYCRQHDCSNLEVELDGGICPGMKPEQAMDRINTAIKTACENLHVNFVDGRYIIEKAENRTDDQWSTTDSGDQAIGFHYDRIHVNYRGNCQVAQYNARDFDHSFSKAMQKSSQYDNTFTCARQVDCTRSANFTDGQWVIPGAGGSLPADNTPTISSDDNSESGLRL